MITPTLRDLYDQIIFYGPEHFDMSVYLQGPGEQEASQEIGQYDFSECGTVGCLAGHGGNLMAQQGIPVNWGYLENNLGFWILVARHFNLDVEIFTTNNWWSVQYKDGTLAGHYVNKFHELDNNEQAAQYYAMVDWLEWELKRREE